MTRRLLFMLFAATTLIAAGCSDDDGDETTATTEEATDTTGAGSDAPAMGPAELTVDDQTGDGTTVVVASVTLPSPGFIAVHADLDGGPGPVIGHSELLDEGESTDVEIELDEALAADADVWPMAHIDTNGNDAYDFDPPDVTEDGPATFADGEVAVVALAYTVAGDGGDAGAGDEASVTVADFTFGPDELEVSVGTTVVWTNEDDADHTVTGDADEFGERLDGGGTAEVTFDEAGTYEYHCEIHPAMTGRIVVS